MKTAGGTYAFNIVPAFFPELCLVERHEAEVEAGEEAGEAEQDDNENGHEPDGQQQRVHLQLATQQLDTLQLSVQYSKIQCTVQ